ncbi:hypothetical protein HWV62_18016 [Athelia sp. TMB]|nr:hypothetical protein HWV62_18016 [Athelia sp. TMB]
MGDDGTANLGHRDRDFGRLSPTTSSYLRPSNVHYRAVPANKSSSKHSCADMTQVHPDHAETPDPAPPAPVDILILGAGWTSTFLLPLCASTHTSCAATSRAGRAGTLPFTFDPHAPPDPAQYAALPRAETVVITFPITVPGASGRLVEAYRGAHGGAGRFVQLGSTGIWGGKDAAAPRWVDRHTPPDADNLRAAAEEELLALRDTAVLNLAGLWGGARSIRRYVGRVAPTKDALRNKGSLHMIHGTDVARALLAVHAAFARAAGQRFVLSDARVYDWWDLASAWAERKRSEPGEVEPGERGGRRGEGGGGDGAEKGGEGEGKGAQAAWVRELMDEAGVRALPRDAGLLGRVLDGRDFWRVFGLSPVRARLE